MKQVAPPTNKEPQGYTIDGMEVYEDFHTGLQKLKKPVLIYHQAWNKQLGLDRGQWVAIIARTDSSVDGASLPKLAQHFMWLCPNDTRLKKAGVGHDTMYRYQRLDLYLFNKEKRKIERHLGTYEISQKDADVFFKWKIRDDGLDITRTNMAYLGLRIGGHYTYDEYTELLKHDIHR